MSAKRVTPVILSGGSGTRLWPLSRPERPKQLQALTGEATMLRLTAARVDDPALFDAPILVANAAHAELVEAQLAGIGPAALILEPCARNTAPAIALAALAAAPDALLLVMPSDHVIADVAAFRAAVATAVPVAEAGWLVTFGIRPDRAETGYGYIRRGGEVAPGVFAAEQFLEKPDLATAAGFVAGGKHDWNGGIFLFRADALLTELDAQAPQIAAAARAAAALQRRQDNRSYPDAQAFAASPAQSIDYAVMEKAARVAVVPVAMGWSDVGSWDALYEIGARDAAGNAVAGDALALDSKGCLIRSDGPLVAAVGVEDLIIVATADAVLVVPRGQSQRVKDAVETVNARGKPR